MLLDLIKKLSGKKNDSLDFNKNLIKSKSQISMKSANYSTPTISLNNDNIVHNENRTEKEIEALYAEIRVLQAKNREKANKSRIYCNLAK